MMKRTIAARGLEPDITVVSAAPDGSKEDYI
jgi:hypothetical protein